MPSENAIEQRPNISFLAEERGTLEDADNRNGALLLQMVTRRLQEQSPA